MEKRFLGRVAGFSLGDSKRSTVIQEGHRVEPLPLHIEESLVYLLWCFLGEVFLLFPTKRNTMERLFIIYIYISAGLSDPGRAGGGGSLSGSVHLCLDGFCCRPT